MTPVLGQEFAKARQVTVWQRFFINVLEYFRCRGCKTQIESAPQFLIKGSVQVILYHFFTEVGSASFITQNIPESGAVLYNFLSIVITGIGTGAEYTGNTLFFAA